MSDVPCNGCIECCKGPDRQLALDPLDDPSEYLTYRRGETVYLGRKSNDDCVYLTEEGCSIYERRPLVCRRFDCREYLTSPALPERVRVQALMRV